MKLIIAIFQYLMSTVRHKAYVFYAGVFIVGDIPFWRLVIHDYSKFYPVEFVNYARFYNLNEGYEYQKHEAFLKAWMHHQKTNKHHPEYWTSLGVFSWANGSVEMPETYIREWVADLLGASKEYTNSWNINEWIKENIRRWDYCDYETLFMFNEILQEINVPIEFVPQFKKLHYVGDKK